MSTGSDCREADCRIKGGENNDAMNAYHNAAKSYKKSDPEGQSRRLLRCIPSALLTFPPRRALCLAAIAALHQTIKLLIKAGSFRQAADREKEVRHSHHSPTNTF